MHFHEHFNFELVARHTLELWVMSLQEGDSGHSILSTCTRPDAHVLLNTRFMGNDTSIDRNKENLCHSEGLVSYDMEGKRSIMIAPDHTAQ